MSEILNSPIFWGVAIVLVFMIFIYNNLNASNRRVKTSADNIDEYLRERETTITTLLDNELTKMDMEIGMQKDIAEIRSLANKCKSGDVKDKVNLDNAFSTFIAAHENYPELRSMDSYKATVTKTIKSGEDIRDSIIAYNKNASKYNTKITSFPMNIFAKIFGFAEEYPKLFELTEQQKKEMLSGVNLKTGALAARRKKYENIQ